MDNEARKMTADMSDRELLIELVEGQRVMVDAVNALSESPMVKAMANGSNPLMAMMRG